MKIAQAIITAVALGTLSFGAVSAELLTKEALKEHPDMYTKIGTIVTDGELAPSDAKEELAKKADEKGGDFYVVTSADTQSKIHATADVYKKN
ncbi:DUF1471 family periplasmic protein YahO [Enterobacteriaceae bacterium H20N1]|uniref:DUF1471 family periplasmic protein YahO n=1 Tax=Dryocola boscaweniae TaxID=2925397 RepID=A0A9X2W5T0_9ENTR|nr:DUF1471 family periplasmic protein YahO [Dryocola boscaweniae]MCT4701595.1 DUF1471 family periplasmic protein YahO [Dryocola boscaweniae]MCT4716237.1 DUF1471 family periplasmic protein YahO [Dryocola boscaweniae]MCT4718764.1 DUF1471 family periplasmic protein YahO [Dryocola boscaweniae]